MIPAPMERPDPGQVTTLLAAASGGDPAARQELFAVVYAELYELARRALRRERPGHTLQPTALVHEAFLRLMRQDSMGCRTPAEFLGVAAKAMRRILVDHARARGRQKRGGGATATGLGTELDEMADHYEARALDLLTLDEALDELAAFDAPKAELVELRFFAGLSMAEAATVRGTSLRAAERDWTLARAFLRSRLGGAWS